MEDARKKLRVCLICVVALAVLVGAVYYFHDVKGSAKISEGTLITISAGIPDSHFTGGGALWQ